MFLGKGVILSLGVCLYIHKQILLFKNVCVRFILFQFSIKYKQRVTFRLLFLAED